MKKLYHISQTINNDYDTYSDAVVCAESIEKARRINPGGDKIHWHDEPKHISKGWWDLTGPNGLIKPDDSDAWCPLKDVKVRVIGIAGKKVKIGVICDSFHAG